jgi:outer membrane protein assembly factor BamD
MMKTIVRAGVLALLFAGLVACSSTNNDDELLTRLGNQDKDEIFAEAEALYTDEEYSEARALFSFLYDTFPNDPLGHKAALRVADTYSVKNDTTNLTEARLRYRDFANRYPNDPDRDYALLMLGNTYTARLGRPDRDLSHAREGIKAYQQLVHLYPQSAYVDAAEERIRKVEETFAEHEWLVAKFYARNKRWRGTLWRLEYLKTNYPGYPNMDAVDELMAKAQGELSARQTEIEEMKRMQKLEKIDDHQPVQ